MVLYARSQDSLLSLSMRGLNIVLHSTVFVFSTTVFKGGGRPCYKTCKIAALRRGIPLSVSWNLYEGGDTAEEDSEYS